MASKAAAPREPAPPPRNLRTHGTAGVSMLPLSSRHRRLGVAVAPRVAAAPMRMCSPGLDDRQELGLRVDRQLLQMEPAHRLLGLPTANDNRADGAHLCLAQRNRVEGSRGIDWEQGLTADVQSSPVRGRTKRSSLSPSLLPPPHSWFVAGTDSVCRCVCVRSSGKGGWERERESGSARLSARRALHSIGVKTHSRSVRYFGLFSHATDGGNGGGEGEGSCGGGGGDGGGSAAGGGGGGEGATEKLMPYRFLAQLCPRDAGERAGEAIGREPNLRAVLRLAPTMHGTVFGQTAPARARVVSSPREVHDI